MSFVEEEHLLGCETIVFLATEATSEWISSVYFPNAEDADSFMACEATRKSACGNFLATDVAVLFLLHLWIPWLGLEGAIEQSARFNGFSPEGGI